MMSEIGTLLIGLTFITALYAGFATLVGLKKVDGRWIESGKHALYAVPVLSGIALALLGAAFLTDNFELEYVAQHTSRALSPYLKLSAIWAGQEGSLLLWAFLQALLTAIAVGYPTKRTVPLLPWATVFMTCITAFFSAVTLLLSNPFVPAEVISTDGMGLNPLLRHPGMIFHPPAMYVGYVGVAVPFSFAMAALVTGKTKDWTKAARFWILLAWVGLGTGLLLGMRWAYDVLGWGGYWGWDPVENAGLMPWLTTTALLHSAIMQQERRNFQLWNFLLIIVSFTLVLFGTFATRSGVIESVHAYAQSGIGNYFLGAIIVTLAGSLGLLLWRRSHLAPKTQPTDTDHASMQEKQTATGILSREGMFTLTLILLSTLTFSIFIGSVLPTLTQTIFQRRFEAGPAWFDRVTGPQFAALVLILGFCPLLGRSIGTLKRLKWAWVAIGGAGLATGMAAMAGFTQTTSLLGFSIAGLSGATLIVELSRAMARQPKGIEQFIISFSEERTQRLQRKYGGAFVHLGVICMALGIIGTRLYPFEQSFSLRMNEPVVIKGFTFQLEEMKQESTEEILSTWANVSIHRGEQYLITLMPRLDRYRDLDQTVSIPAVHPRIREDLYLILNGWENQGTTVNFKLIVSPLINFLWLGGLVFLTGGILATWPTKESTLSSPSGVDYKARTWNSIGLLLALAVMVGVGISMWGIPHGAMKQSSWRPLPGQEAPKINLILLDGQTTALPDPSSTATLLNFWAPECPSCEDGLPLLQTVWEQYQTQGLSLVGIAQQTDEQSVQKAIETYGLTYPISIDNHGEAARAYGITGVPEIFILNAEGKVVYVHVGLPKAEQLIDEVKGIISQEASQ